MGMLPLSSQGTVTSRAEEAHKIAHDLTVMLMA
jgi:hypothetical protein